jgi:hypothetical protein
MGNAVRSDVGLGVLQFAQIAEARSQTRQFGHDNALPQGSAETSFQRPFEHPESHLTGDLCSIPLPCNSKDQIDYF